MARVKTFINGGSLLPADLNSVEDDYEAAFSTYKLHQRVRTRFDTPAAGTFVLLEGAAAVASAASAGLAVFALDPAWYAASPRTVVCRVHVGAIVNATAPTVNFTTGLYPVTGIAGGASAVTLTLGAVVSGSTIALNAPGAGAYANGASSDFNCPSAGAFVLATLVSGSAAANSSLVLAASLQYRQT